MLLILTVVVAVLAARVIRRRGRRIVAWAVVVVLVLVNVTGAVNAYYGYVPTLGEAFGGPGPDEDSLADADRDAASGLIPAVGQVVPAQIPGTASGFTARTGQVYLPPAWFARPRPALPVLLLLHGTPGDPTDWTVGGGAQTTADAWAAAHRGRAPILVMPDVNGDVDADTECVDSPLGNAETYLTVDVPAMVQQEFGTLAPGRDWAVAGLSEGGTCSIMLALRHPDKFTAFGQYGGLVGPRRGDTNDDTASILTGLFGGSQQAFAAHEPSTLLTTQRFVDLGGWFEVGADDPEPLAAAQQLVPLAEKAGIATCLVVVPGGGHTFDVWTAAFRDSLPWLSARVGLVPPDPGMTSSCQAG